MLDLLEKQINDQIEIKFVGPKGQYLYILNHHLMLNLFVLIFPFPIFLNGGPPTSPAHHGLGQPFKIESRPTKVGGGQVGEKVSDLI